MVRKHDYNFRYFTNMLKISSRGFDRVQNCDNKDTINPLQLFVEKRQLFNQNNP